MYTLLIAIYLHTGFHKCSYNTLGYAKTEIKYIICSVVAITTTLYYA